MVGVGDGDTRAGCEVSLGFAVKTPERHNWGQGGVFTVSLGHD